jgi:hypothetical protein
MYIIYLRLILPKKSNFNADISYTEYIVHTRIDIYSSLVLVLVLVLVLTFIY